MRRSLIGLVILAGVGYLGRSFIAEKTLPYLAGTDAMAETELARQYYYDDDQSGATAHNHFSLADLSSDDSSDPAEPTPPEPAPTSVRIAGAWEATVMADTVADYITRNNCLYALTGFNLSLRESEGSILGYGDYSLQSDRCPSGLRAVSAYAVATGVTNPPYVKLTIRESDEGPVLFVFFGTARPEGILGQVRTTDGRLLLEHVALMPPSR